MPYTEFRKSYGDFEVVIPAIDFSSLSRVDATKAAHALRSYKGGYVCEHVDWYEACIVANLIAYMFKDYKSANCNTIGKLIDHQFGHNKNIPLFTVHRQSGITLRKAWCKHMANEIEREFDFKL